MTGFRNSTGQTVYVEAVGMSATELGPGGNEAARAGAVSNAIRRRSGTAGLGPVLSERAAMRGFKNEQTAQGVARAERLRSSNHRIEVLQLQTGGGPVSRWAISKTNNSTGRTRLLFS